MACFDGKAHISKSMALSTGKARCFQMALCLDIIMWGSYKLIRTLLTKDYLYVHWEGEREQGEKEEEEEEKKTRKNKPK